ncbi:hypothetical protein OG719_38010 [Microbispora hainanensis]
MPSPVSGLIRLAASPASSTRPAPGTGRPLDSGRWWARRSRTSPGGLSIISGSSRASRPCSTSRPGSPVSRMRGSSRP